MQHQQFQTRPRRPKWTGCLPLHWSNSRCLSCPFHLASLESLVFFHFKGSPRPIILPGNLRPKMPPFREVSGNLFASSSLGSLLIFHIDSNFDALCFVFLQTFFAATCDLMPWSDAMILLTSVWFFKKKCTKPRGKWLVIFMFAISWWSILFGEPNCFNMF